MNQVFEGKLTSQRVLVFCVGLLFLGFGIDMNTKTMLGLSPINSVPYNVHTLFDIPLWMCVYGFYALCVLLQWALLREKFHPVQFLQLLTSLVNSFVIQFFDDRLPFFSSPFARFAALAVAVVSTAIGISLTAGMKLVPNPGEGAASAMAIAMRRDLGFAKNTLDLGCVCLSVVFTLVAAGRVMNIGVGTVVSMLLTGRVVKLFSKPTAALYRRVS